MKRTLSVIFTMVVVCSLSLSAEFVNAANAAYTNNDYQAVRTPVVDGKWTTNNEWYDAAIPPSLPAGVHFSEKWTYPENLIVQYYLFEYYNDNTNDANDYVYVCYDPANDGGTAPKADDVKIEIKGHNTPVVTVYRGTGTGWAVYTGSVSMLSANSTLGPSSFSSTSHCVTELRFEKAGILELTGGYSPPIKVAWFDASSSGEVKEWPPGSGDDPSKWGIEAGTMENIPAEVTIPEPLAISAVILLSSVAVLVGACYLRKRPKVTILTTTKQ